MLLEGLAEDFVFISAFLLIFSIMLYGGIRVWLREWLPVPSHRWLA